MIGELSILNVGVGDVKISFDNGDLADVIRAKRIIADMLRRGYALIVEVERDGEKKYERVQEFDEACGEYIIADFTPVESRSDPRPLGPQPPSTEEMEQAVEQIADAVKAERYASLCKCGRPAHHRGACKGPRKRLSMETTKATGIGRSAGG